MFQSIVGWWLREFAPPFFGNLGQAICSSILFSYSSFWLADMSRNTILLGSFLHPGSSMQILSSAPSRRKRRMVVMERLQV